MLTKRRKISAPACDHGSAGPGYWISDGTLGTLANFQMVSVGLSVLFYAVGLLAWFLVWTLIMYALHRLGHVHSKRNPFWIVHTAHHRIAYLTRRPVNNWPKLAQFWLWLGDWRTSLDVFITMTLPLILIAWVVPEYGIPLLVFHYFYEIFLSEHRLDHNPYVSGAITKVFAWGDFHLYHHAHPRKNFGLLITLWDRVFGSAIDPEPGSARRRLEHLMEREAALKATALKATQGN
jgi:sterol desaturase/sphingolipid hydroxylase (fatty acid hydroxylase superfamily)